MTDAEAQFAARLAEDLERVLGAGLAVDDIDLRIDDQRAHVTASVLIDGRVERIDAEAPDVLGLYRPLVERAAELRLGAAWWRIVGPV